MSTPPDNSPSFVDEFISNALGKIDWLRSVLLGEFAPERPLSALVAEMLLNFIPGVVLVTSARDAVAIVIRMVKHPEKQDEPMEWIYLCSCLIVIALPLAMAAGGASFALVGAAAGALIGEELSAVLKAVMLLLMKESQHLVEVIRTLQKFMKGDILKFLRRIKFAEFEKPLIAALKATTKKMIDICEGLRLRLHNAGFVNDFHKVKQAIATLAEWEAKFYGLQRSALINIPKAIVQLDHRMAVLLEQVILKDAHTAAAGVKAEAPVAQAIKQQRIHDLPGQALRAVEHPPAAAAKARPRPATKARAHPPAGAAGKAPRPVDKAGVHAPEHPPAGAAGAPSRPVEQAHSPAVDAPSAHPPGARPGPVDEPRMPLVDDPLVPAPDAPQWTVAENSSGIKNKPEPIEKVLEGPNTKRQATADAVGAADGPAVAGAKSVEPDIAELRKTHGKEIDDVSTFKTLGVDRATADTYLATSNGQQYIKELSAADPGADANTIYLRAVDQLSSGSGVPEMISTSSPLIKIVPQGQTVSAYSPFFTTEADLSAASKSGSSLADYFGLPAKSGAPVYDIFQISPNGSANVFMNTVAPTSELGGLVARNGGAVQYIVPNRGAWLPPVHIGTIGN